jgi:hypothetical protein
MSRTLGFGSSILLTCGDVGQSVMLQIMTAFFWVTLEVRSERQSCLVTQFRLRMLLVIWESSAEMGNSASLSPSFSLVIYLNVCRGLCEFAKWITGLFLPVLLFVCCGRLRLVSDFIVHCVMAFIRRTIFFYIFVWPIPLCYCSI